MSVEGNLRDGINWQCSNGGVLFPPPPEYPPSSRQQLLYLNTSFSCIDIINKVIGNIFCHIDGPNRAFRQYVIEKLSFSPYGFGMTSSLHFYQN